MLAAIVCAGGWRGAAVAAPTGSPAAAADRLEARIRVEVGACVIEAPPALRVHLEALAQRAASILPRIESSLGVRPAAPYRILLIPPGRSDDPEMAALDASAPPWAAGFVQPWRRLGGIRVARADRYPYSDLASVLTHEATHMLLFDAARGALPRWFEEGVASGLERSWGLRDMAVWSSSLLTGRLPELADLDAAFESSESRARAAYAASFDFMTWTVRRYGAGVVRDIVREAAARPFPEAWEAAAGEALLRSESEWRRSSVLLYRWVPALTGTGALWAGITVLALAAGARRRARSRAIRERWEAEERRGPAAGSAHTTPGTAIAAPGVRSLEFFQEVYEGGTPPWDIGRPQPEVVRLAGEGRIRGSVLDVGCGTGENALYLAGLGHEVWGIDGAPLAVEQALSKAGERGVVATFLVADALDLGSLGRTFDTVIDSGLFHVFSDEDRPRFVRGLAAVVRPGGTYFLICFSEREPGTEGPRRVTQGEIRSAFGRGWRIEDIREARFETNRESGDARAWLATITRA
jgi:2-polyprenyl-3-methyl-5-hydroxy-6-metoxy-1,4-benzoquinol methylase